MVHRALASYGPKAADDAEVLKRHGNIVDRLARRMTARTGLSSLHDDLWSAGALGLLEAAKKFDPSRGATFETFAEHRVRGAMLDELRRMDHLPRRLRAKADDVVKGRRDLATKLGRDPDAAELAAELGLSQEELAEMETLVEPHVSLDWALGMAAERDTEDPMVRAEIAQALAGAIEELPERLRLVLNLIYIEDLSYGEVGQLLEISKPRVCQIHADAIEKLRVAMAERG